MSRQRLSLLGDQYRRKDHLVFHWSDQAMTPKQLAEEFRRLAAEARSGASRTQSDYRRAVNSSRAQTFEQAAKMLEEKLS
jgi:hypothetical protein